MTLCTIEECDRPVKVISRGLCNKHYRRWQDHGDPRATVIEQRPSGALFEEWFWSQFRPNGECLDWTGGTANGYGRTSTPDRDRTGTHILAWILTYGVDPSDFGLCVCHTCDRPICGNPDHLFLGTDGGNTADKVAKGRQTKGSGFSHSKLTESDVVDILYYLADGHSQSQTAAAFGVARSTIGMIWQGRAWRWVTH